MICLTHFFTYFILLNLFWLLDLFYDFFFMLWICFMVTSFPYFAIKYDVEFDNLLIILFLPQIYYMPILLYFFMIKAT